MKKIFQNIIFYFIAISFAKTFGVLRSFLLAKIISPSEYGIWISLKLIVTFGPIISLGVVETLSKLVPYYRGKKDEIKKIEIEGGVLSFIHIINFIIVLSIVTISLINTHKIITYKFEIIIMLLSLGFGLYSSYYFYRLKAYQNFKVISLIEFFRTIILLTFQIPLAYIYNSLGAVLGFLFCEIIICLISFKTSYKYNKKVKLVFNKSLYLHIIHVGLPITIIWWTYIIQSTTDRVICIWLLGKQLTGYYGLGVSFVSILLLVSTSVSSILYPQMNKKFGENEKKELLLPLVTNPAMIISIFLPIIIALIYYSLPLVYKYFLINYYPGLISAQILIIGSFFSSNTRNGANYLISVNEQKIFIRYVVIATLFNIIGNFSLVYLGFGINGIAISTAVSNFIIFTLLWIHIYNKRIIKFVKLLFPILLLIFIIIFNSKIFSPQMELSFIRNSIKFFLTLTLYIIILLIIPSYLKQIKYIFKLIKSN